MPSFNPGALTFDKTTFDALVGRIYADVQALELLTTQLQGSSHDAVTVSDPIKIADQALSLGYSAAHFELDGSDNLSLKAGTVTAWNPNWTNLTVGTGGTNTGGYYQDSRTKMVFFWVEVVLGSSGFSVGAASVALPVVSAITTLPRVGEITCLQGATIREGCIIPNGGLRVFTPTTATDYLSRAVISATVPFTWAAGDKIYAGGYYLGV